MFFMLYDNNIQSCISIQMNDEFLHIVDARTTWFLFCSFGVEAPKLISVAKQLHHGFHLNRTRNIWKTRAY